MDVKKKKTSNLTNPEVSELLPAPLVRPVSLNIVPLNLKNAEIHDII